MKKQDVVVKPDPVKGPEPFEIMEQSIIELAAFGRRINASRLGRRAIGLLIRDATGVGFGEIDAVLNCLPRLEEKFLKKQS